MKQQIKHTLITNAIAVGCSIAIAKTIDTFAAAREGNSRDIKIYAQYGGNVKVTNNKSYTPFILATYNGHTDAAETLLQVGADACALDNKGNNAFMDVAFKGHQQVATWFDEIKLPTLFAFLFLTNAISIVT